MCGDRFGPFCVTLRYLVIVTFNGKICPPWILFIYWILLIHFVQTGLPKPRGLGPAVHSCWNLLRSNNILSILVFFHVISLCFVSIYCVICVLITPKYPHYRHIRVLHCCSTRFIIVTIWGHSEVVLRSFLRSISEVTTLQGELYHRSTERNN